MSETRRIATSDAGTVVGRFPSRDVLPDQEVVRRVLAGETVLFEVLMRRYNQRLYCVARTILRDDSGFSGGVRWMMSSWNSIARACESAPR